MDQTSAIDRLRQELDLLIEYLDSAKSIDPEFLRLHAELLVSYVWDVEQESLPKAA